MLRQWLNISSGEAWILLLGRKRKIPIDLKITVSGYSVQRWISRYRKLACVYSLKTSIWDRLKCTNKTRYKSYKNVILYNVQCTLEAVDVHM